MPDSRRVEELILKRISDDNEVIDVRGLVSDFRIDIIYGDLCDDTLVGHLYEEKHEDKNQRRFVRLRETLTEQEQNTVLAILLARYCLHEDKIKDVGYRISVFDMKSIRENRFSRMMYLATRFALPEKLIARMDDVIFGNIKIRATEKYTSDFIFSSVKGPTIQFLLDNNIA